jgi:preprotein translocase subunit SecD
MNNLNKLLRDADPVRHEKAVPPGYLARQRTAILAEASVGGAAVKKGLRQKYALLAMASLAIMAAALLGSNLRSFLPGKVFAAVNFEVRLAEDHPSPGLREARVSGSDRLVYLHNDIVVTNGDISRAEVVQGNGPSQFSVSVEFTAAGAKKMRSATESHMGKPMAILLDGQVVMAPTIRAPIDSSAMITGNYTKAEAERIANGLR